MSTKYKFCVQIITENYLFESVGPINYALIQSLYTYTDDNIFVRLHTNQIKKKKKDVLYR